jgi:hypothetical protein
VRTRRVGQASGCGAGRLGEAKYLVPFRTGPRLGDWVRPSPVRFGPDATRPNQTEPAAASSHSSPASATQPCHPLTVANKRPRRAPPRLPVRAVPAAEGVRQSRRGSRSSGPRLTTRSPSSATRFVVFPALFRSQRCDVFVLYFL